MPVVTIVGSITGILIALDQITAAARLRRRAAFWREMATQSHALPRDVEVFHSLQRQATARVIALQLKPARNILWSAMNLVVIITTTVGLGVMIGQVPPSELSWETAWRAATDEMGIPFFLVLPSLIGISTVSFIDLSLNRSRISRDYLNGKDITVQKFRQEDRSPTDKLGWAGTLQILAFSVGLTLWPAGVGGMIGSGMHDTPSWAILFAVVGAPLAFMTGGALIMKTREHSVPELLHPRPLARRLRRPRPVLSLGTSRKVTSGRTKRRPITRNPS
ncbi:hypothetical protein ANMWB30_24240 [Arthrobacter sp. MWB30]|nr:hypothetical protein ANMWB30_24240 [Arthrobacter sp. MWB30]